MASATQLGKTGLVLATFVMLVLAAIWTDSLAGSIASTSLLTFRNNEDGQHGVTDLSHDKRILGGLKVGMMKAFSPDKLESY